jgi:hypothetical protein
MMGYNPDIAPAADEWLGLDEGERITHIEEYHLKARIKLPSATAHATIHAIVENQIAEGLEPVVRTMHRLVREGVSRHDALHAIGSLVAEYLIFETMQTNQKAETSLIRYNAALERLKAKDWR